VRRLELDGVRPALERVLQIDLDLGDVILSRLSEAARASSPTALTEALPERTALAEQGGEEVAEVRILAAGAPAAERRRGELEVATPVGRRPEFLAGAPVRAELIVGSAALRVLQDLVRLLHFLELLLGVLFLADVRVKFTRQPSIDALDLVLARVASHAHDLVIVLVSCHRAFSHLREPQACEPRWRQSSGLS